MDGKFGKVLVVDDNEDVLLSIRLLLKKHVATVHTEKRPEVIPNLLRNEQYDVILLDMNFSRDVSSGQEGFYWLNHILELDPSAVVILITAYGGVELAVRAIKEGATDFVLKPFQNEKMLATVSAALKLRQTQTEAELHRWRQRQLSADIDQPFHEIIGVSSAMQKVFATIEKVAGTSANILILGESGTGKELVARALHRHSRRAGEVFISVDLGALSETLFESELFGHVKGAFTDAREDRAGRFEIASGGTIFLDEIGNLPLPLQAKLLTVIQTRQVTRLGSNRSRAIDIRLICASNMNINQMVLNNQFRQDLMYRINTVEIHLPSLRERLDDIPLLAEHFLRIYNKKYHKLSKRFAPVTLQRLQHYHWPGNVRELQNAIERALILSEADILQPQDFFFPEGDAQSQGLALENLNLDEVEKILVRKALDKHRGNISKAAGELGLTRASLYRRLEKYGL
ncbi:MAG: sigma-54-dependent Fis family transcriptional regulator [Acidobacteria bacterium]|nr:sigma-54-dependent Fis family transcriptional regulator [Acidobacteriota bacterium]